MIKKHENTLILIGTVIFLAIAVVIVYMHFNTNKKPYVLNGISEEVISVNNNNNSLDIEGNLKIQSGEATIYVIGKDTGDTLYSRKFTVKDKGYIDMDVDDLKHNKRVIFRIEGKKAKGLELDLNY